MLTNIGFFIAALVALGVQKGQIEQGIMDLAAILLAGTIGIGAILFHTFANNLAELADELPIWTFVTC